MCIKTLHAKGNKVVGLSINGKHFLLNKEICNALRIEELRTRQDFKSTQKEAVVAKKEIDKQVFYGESEHLDIQVIIGDGNQIDSNSTKVEFKNKYSLVPDDKREDYLELLDLFLVALNQAIRSHQQVVNDTFKNIVAKNKEAS